MRHPNLAAIAVRIAVAAASSAIALPAIASPYYILYRGTISGSNYPEIQDGQGYTVRLVFDNGNASVASQTWNASHLKCVLWTMNNVENVSYSQDLTTTQGTLQVSGLIVTDAGGALTSNFSELDSYDPNSGTYSSVGFTPARPIYWYLNDANDVFYSNNRQFGDSAGGVQMAVGNWQNPVPFVGTCPVTILNNPVPTVSEWTAVAMSGLLALGAVFAMRRKRRPSR